MSVEAPTDPAAAVDARGASLELFDSEWDQPASLLPVREVIGGYYREVGVTFAGGTLLEDRSQPI